MNVRPHFRLCFPLIGLCFFAFGKCINQWITAACVHSTVRWSLLKNYIMHWFEGVRWMIQLSANMLRPLSRGLMTYGRRRLLHPPTSSSKITKMEQMHRGIHFKMGNDTPSRVVGYYVMYVFVHFMQSFYRSLDCCCSRSLIEGIFSFSFYQPKHIWWLSNFNGRQVLINMFDSFVLKRGFLLATTFNSNWI